VEQKITYNQFVEKTTLMIFDEYINL